MGQDQEVRAHSAEAAALGFYYQAFFALLTLVEQTTDNAAVGIEQLDDVELKADGQTLLYQLKHSISAAPPPVSLKSRALWRTLKVWALSETTLHLVSVGGVAEGSLLHTLTDLDADRTELVQALTEEAQRVVEARKAAAKANKPLPHGDRVDGCEAFIGLTETARMNLIRRTVVRQDSPNVAEIEDQIAEPRHIAR